MFQTRGRGGRVSALVRKCKGERERAPGAHTPKHRAGCSRTWRSDAGSPGRAGGDGGKKCVNGGTREIVTG